MQRRFFYKHSVVNGWCVYDRQESCAPAYEACAELLPFVDKYVAESPVLLENEFAAMKLCRRLNVAWERSQKNG